MAVQNFHSLINGRTQNEVVANGMLRKVSGSKGESKRSSKKISEIKTSTFFFPDKQRPDD